MIITLKTIRKTLCLSGFLYVQSICPGFAQDITFDGILERWNVSQKLQVGGTFFMGDAATTSSGTPPPKNYEYGAIYTWDGVFELSDSILFNLDGFVRGSYQNLYEGVFSGPQRDNQDSPFFDFTEFALNFENENYDFIIGKTSLNIGMAELYSPIDVFGASDATMPFSPVSYGRWQMQSKIYLDNDTLTLAYFPFDTGLAGPKKYSRWSGKSTNSSFFSATGDIKDSTRKNGFESASVAAIYEGVGTGFDYVIGGFAGLSPYPTVKQVGFELYEDRPTVAGLVGGISYIVDNTKYYVDTAYQNARSGKDDDFIKSTFGISYTDSNYAADLGMNKINLIAEYAWDYRLQRQSHPNYTTSSEDARPYPMVLLGKAEFEVSDKVKIIVGGSVGMKYDDNTQFVVVNYGVTDDLTISFQGRFFAGKEGSQFASQAENDYILIGAEYNF